MLMPSIRKRYTKGDQVYVARKCFYDTYIRLCLGDVLSQSDDGCLISLKDCSNSYFNCELFVPFDCLYIHHFWINHDKCRKAVLLWLYISELFGRRGRSTIPRDLRRLIGQYVWKTRDDKVWEIMEHKHRRFRPAQKKIKSYK
jgi:hypothetical protein